MNSNATEWMVCINITTASASLDDDICIGEFHSSEDGQDSSDIPKPGHPPSPFVYGWLQTNFPNPYDVLWEEYKKFDPVNKTYEEWDLWVHTDDVGDSIYTCLDWGNPLIGTGYDNAGLFDMVSGEMVADMTSVTTYCYYAYHCCPQWFQIRLWDNACRTAVDDYYVTYQETCLIIDAPGVLANDIDPDGLGLEIISINTSGLVGTITWNPDGSFEYCPPHNWSGNTSFSYLIEDESGCQATGCPEIAAIVTITVMELYGIEVEPGWNLISVPVGGECDDINGGCQMYTGDVDCLISGEGYWLYAYENVDILVPIDQCEDYHGTHITYLCEGWNLVGVPYPVDMFLDTDINVLYQSYAPALWPTAAANGWVLEFVYGWNRTEQNYEIINTGYGDGYLRSGQGYWMYSFVGAALKKDPGFTP
jgi:hypothetical protein